MRVLNVVGSLLLGGGIETALLRILRAAPRAGIEIDFCISGPSAPTLHHEFEQLGCGVWACRQGRDAFGFTRRFERELRARPAYDVVHAHVSNFSGPVLRAARRAGVPRRIAQYHNLAVGHANDWLRRLVERWLRRMVLREATGIAAITHAGLRHWFPREHERDSRMRVLRYGIDVGEFAAAAGARNEVRRELGVPPDAPVFGHVGRFVWQKNHATLIEVAARVVARLPAARFLLVGDGELRGEIEQQAAARGVREQVILTGVRRDVPRLLAAMDVLVFPSVVEGFGYCQLEAQAAGVPVVASRIATAPEAVAPVFHEYLREPRDADGLADAALELLARSRREPALAQAAREFAGEFTLQSAAEALLGIWSGQPAV